MIAFTTTHILHQNKPARESIFCGKVGEWWPKRALIMLKSTPKTRQKQFCRIHAHRQRHRKHLCLRPQARAVAKHAAHGQRRQYHANAEVICQWQPVSWLVKNALNDFRRVTFWDITTFFHRQMRQNFIFHCIFVQYIVHERGVYLSFTAQRQ